MQLARFPGGFNKREGKASEHAILTSRVIDRPMRPLFPKDYRNDVTLVQYGYVCRSGMQSGDSLPCLVLPLLPAFPISRLTVRCATTQVGLIDGEFIINPTPAQKEVSDLAADSCFHKRESYHDRSRCK